MATVQFTRSTVERHDSGRASLKLPRGVFALTLVWFTRDPETDFATLIRGQAVAHHQFRRAFPRSV
jgi:hypothetical protein